MATSNVTPVAPATETPKGIKKIVKRNVFDLGKFERVSLEKEVYLPLAPTTMEEALAAVDNDDAKLLKVIAKGLRSMAISEAKNSIALTGDFVSPKVVSGTVNQFKALYPPKSDSKADVKAAKDQLYSFVRANEGLVNVIRITSAALAAAQANVEDDDDDDEADDAGE